MESGLVPTNDPPLFRVDKSCHGDKLAISAKSVVSSSDLLLGGNGRLTGQVQPSDSSLLSSFPTGASSPKVLSNTGPELDSNHDKLLRKTFIWKSG